MRSPELVLGGSWVVTSGVIRPLIWVIRTGTLLITTLNLQVVLATGLLSNQGEKSINFYFIMVPLKEKSIKVWYSKAQPTSGTSESRAQVVGQRSRLRD